MQNDGHAIRLRPAEPREAAELSHLALRSKAVWGYDTTFLEACRAELTLTPDQIVAGGVTVAEVAGRPAGFSRLGLERDGNAEILLLFVDPGLLGSGIGRTLFAELEAAARSAGASRLCCDADPGAEAFYRRMGMARIGDAASGSIPGRRLPRLAKPLS